MIVVRIEAGPEADEAVAEIIQKALAVAGYETLCGRRWSASLSAVKRGTVHIVGRTFETRAERPDSEGAVSMQHDAHVQAYRHPRTIFLYELPEGGHVRLVKSAGLDWQRCEWATRRLIEMRRAELRREWEATR